MSRHLQRFISTLDSWEVDEGVVLLHVFQEKLQNTNCQHKLKSFKSREKKKFFLLKHKNPERHQRNQSGSILCTLESIKGNNEWNTTIRSCLIFFRSCFWENCGTSRNTIIRVHDQVDDRVFWSSVLNSDKMIDQVYLVKSETYHRIRKKRSDALLFLI